MQGQPPQATSVGPEVLPTGYEAMQLDQSLSEAEMDREPVSPASSNAQGELLEESTDQDLSEEANYRETIRGVRSFMVWLRSLTSTVPLLPWMIILLPVPESNQLVKYLSSYRWMSGCVEKFERQCNCC